MAPTEQRADGGAGRGCSAGELVGDTGVTGGLRKKSVDPLAQLKGCSRPPATSVGSSLLTF